MTTRGMPNKNKVGKNTNWKFQHWKKMTTGT